MSVVNDYSAIDDLEREFSESHKATIEERLSSLRTAEKRAAADLRFKTGIAVLCIGAGIGLACWGASYVIPPKIIEKPVVTEKLVYVDKPIITERVVTVDNPVIVERPVPTPAPAPIQQPTAKPRTEAEFKNQSDFKNAQYSGIIESYVGGDITFSEGKKFNHIKGNDRLDKPWLVGKYAYCIMSNPELQRYMCYSWVNGRQEPI
jgi:hypothetical protein